MGIKLDNNRFVYIELTKIYGIGLKKSLKFCKKEKIISKRVKEINKNEFNLIKSFLSKQLTGIDLKKKIDENIKRLIKINCYRGIRHKKKLPVRGQRTRTNSRTARKKL